MRNFVFFYCIFLFNLILLSCKKSDDNKLNPKEKSELNLKKKKNIEKKKIKPISYINFSDDENEFLDDLARRSYRFFEEQCDKTTGLAPDRSKLNGSSNNGIASIASTGFALAAHCIAAERGWIPKQEALSRVLLTLKHLANVAEHKNGFYFHFLELNSGKRTWESEASSIDTAFLIGGAFTCWAYFDLEEVKNLVDKIYERVNWPWMLNGEQTFSMGWKPESGFIPDRWNTYSEHLLLQLLALGTKKFAVEEQCWHSWTRTPVLHFKGEPFAHYPPLFIHQFSHAFFDFRNKKDKYYNYFKNSRLAALAQIDFMSALAEKYPERFGHYGKDLWGLTASDAPNAYRDWGGPYNDNEVIPHREIDGTITPQASAGSMPFTPRESLRTLKFQKKNFGERIYARYGFTNAFNPVEPNSGWASCDVIGIDTGNTLLMIENARSGFVWQCVMKHPAILKAEKIAGFVSD